MTRPNGRRDLRHDRRCSYRGAACGGGHTLFSNHRGDLATTAAADVAPRLFAMAGVGPTDIDVA